MNMNFMQYQQPVQRPSYYQTQTGFNMNRIKPVSSFEEVKATSIDFDGSVFYFPDLANKKIYTKQIGLDGIPIFNMYELKEMPNNIESVNIDTSQFVTRGEFEKVIKELIASTQKTETIKQESSTQNEKEKFEF